MTTTPCGVLRSTLLDVALSTSLDPALATVCVTRPHAIQAIAKQVWYTVAICAQLKTSCEAAQAPLTLPAFTTAPRRPRGAAAATPSQLNVVLIGCGSCGSRISHHLIETELLHPSALSVITRQPEQLGALSKRGVRCFQQGETTVVKQADVIILACQPGQLSTVAKQIEGNISAHALLLSVCCGISAQKVSSTFRHPLTIATSVEVASLQALISRWMSEDDSKRTEARRHASDDDGGATAGSRDGIRAASGERDRQLMEAAFPSHSILVTSSAPVLNVANDEGIFSGALVVPASSPPAMSVVFPFLDRLVWCLVSMLVQWSTRRRGGRMNPEESLLTVWGLLVASPLRSRLASEILSVPERLKELRTAITELQITRTGNGATDGIADYSVCAVSWFATHVAQCSIESVVESIRTQSVYLMVS